jgi:hypothetical protein
VPAFLAFIVQFPLASFYTSRMPGIQDHRQAAEHAVRTLPLRLTVFSVALCLGSPLLLHAIQVRGAVEDFPVVHDGSITVRILDGSDGHPIAHARLSLLAGYNRRDLHLAMWHDDVSTDDHGIARLPNGLANLPLLQISVAKQQICQAGSGSAIFSVDLIRRDGLSTSNRCGNAASEDAPGAFTVFVKSKIHTPKLPKPLKACKVRKPAARPASAAAPAAAPAAPATPAPADPAPTNQAPANTPIQPGDLRALAADSLPALA